MNGTLICYRKFEENKQLTRFYKNFAHFKRYCLLTYSDCAFFILKMGNTAQAAFVMMK